MAQQYKENYTYFNDIAPHRVKKRTYLEMDIAHPVSIEDKGKLICAELHIWFTARSGPAHSHVSSRHSFEFKVPLPGLHRIRPFYSEEADLVNADPLNNLSYSAERAGTVSGCRTNKEISNGTAKQSLGEVKAII